MHVRIGISAAIVLAVLVTAVAAVTPASAAPRVRVSTASYTVWGATDAALRLSVDRRRPTGFDASTRWSIPWSYRSGLRGGRCAVTSARVETRIAYTYPVWRQPASVDATLEARWSRYLARLRVHEEGHGRIGRATGARVEATLRRVSASDCTSLDALLRRAVAREVAAGIAADRAYDARTRHGATQGARFP